MAPVPAAPPGWTAIKVGNEVFFWPTSQPPPTTLEGTHTFSDPPNYRIPDSWSKQPPPEWRDLYGAANRGKDVNPFEVLATSPPPAAPPPPPPPPGQAPPAPPAPAPDGTAPDQQEGAGIEAVKKLEEALKNQNSKTADADRTLASAVLQAHSNTVAGKQKLASLQQSIEEAVNRQTALDTPMGASEFQKFLLTKQKEIIDVVAQADLDDKSKRDILAGLSALYDTPSPDTKGATGSDDKSPEGSPSSNGSGNEAGNGQAGSGSSVPSAPGPDAAGGSGDPLADLLSDPSLSDPGLLGGGTNPLGAFGSQMPQMPSMPSIPGLGGGGLGGLPGLLGGGGTPAATGLSDLLKPKDNPADDPASLRSLLDDPAFAGDHPGTDHPETDKPGALLDQPGEHTEEHKPDGEKTNNEAPTPGAPVPGPLAPPAPPGSGPTEVHLPNGQTVTAPNPQLANVSKAVAAGTPIADALRQNGMPPIPPPGAAVPNPMDPSRITMGAIGQFSDHQIYALSKDLVYMNGQIHPIADASGPGFLGWMPPPEVPTAPLPPPATTVAAPAPAAAPVPSAPAAPAAAAAPAPTPTSGNNLLTPLRR
ncbi:MAG: DUF4226 domain-containing protein [Mycolicibacterium sp.]|uniref:DUF4226 domain-containing protein n=1 Tax=Mycolicibacterium sp. TaxID=2320850 RepID=UPI003D1254EE